MTTANYQSAGGPITDRSRANRATRGGPSATAAQRADDSPWKGNGELAAIIVRDDVRDQLERTAQAAMRHSTIDLTMNTYTDPKLLDMAGALDALPAMPLGGAGDDRQEQRATGTFGKMSSIREEKISLHQLAPTLAPKTGQPSKSVSFADNMAAERREHGGPATIAVNPWNVNENNPLTTAVSGLLEVERKGVEPSTFALRTRRSPN
jgi:hypothetical protein